MFTSSFVINQSNPIQNDLLKLKLVQSLHQHSKVLVRGHVIISEQTRVIVAQTHTQSVSNHHFERMVGDILLLR